VLKRPTGVHAKHFLEVRLRMTYLSRHRKIERGSESPRPSLPF